MCEKGTKPPPLPGAISSSSTGVMAVLCASSSASASLMWATCHSLTKPSEPPDRMRLEARSCMSTVTAPSWQGRFWGRCRDTCTEGEGGSPVESVRRGQSSRCGSSVLCLSRPFRLPPLHTSFPSHLNEASVPHEHLSTLGAAQHFAVGHFKKGHDVAQLHIAKLAQLTLHRSRNHRGWRVQPCRGMKLR